MSDTFYALIDREGTIRGLFETYDKAADDFYQRQIVPYLTSHPRHQIAYRGVSITTALERYEYRIVPVQNGLRTHIFGTA